MDQTTRTREHPLTAEVVDFDEAMLHACAPEVRADLLVEAALLARAFAPGGDPANLTDMAQALSSGERDENMDRSHARQLAAALRHLAARGRV